MNNLLEPVDNGSNYPFRDKMLQARQGRSGFNWSHNRIFTLENAGLLLPVFCAEVLPNSDYDISADLLLRVLPSGRGCNSLSSLYPCLISCAS